MQVRNFRHGAGLHRAGAAYRRILPVPIAGLLHTNGQ
jgi:hypothetical protein